uniref:(northern house mosquito) hypothetical protein n=1 Tax=Culex pipiens TaxID=7175 RepID=A0A8D8P6G3_CULPI
MQLTARKDLNRSESSNLSSAIITCRRTLILIRRSCPSVIDCAINMLHTSRKYSCSRASRRSGCSSILFMLSLKIMVALGVLLLTRPSSRLLTILLASSRCLSSMSTGAGLSITTAGLFSLSRMYFARSRIS